MHSRQTIAGVLALLLWGAWLGPSATATTNDRPPLDVPAGFADGEEAEEDETESILFYGSSFEGDAFFWCLDRSGSMHGAPIQVLKSEVTSAIQSLSRNSDFGLVAFSSSTTEWQPRPHRATPSKKVAAMAWVESLIAAGGTYIGPAGMRSLNLCWQSTKASKVIIVVGDGRPVDNAEALQVITASNYERTPINTILIADTAGLPFMQSLALQNHGQFSFIQ